MVSTTHQGFGNHKIMMVPLVLLIGYSCCPGQLDYPTHPGHDRTMSPLPYIEINQTLEKVGLAQAPAWIRKQKMTKNLHIKKRCLESLEANSLRMEKQMDTDGLISRRMVGDGSL